MAGSPAPVPLRDALANYPPLIGDQLISYQQNTCWKQPVRLASAATIANLSSVTVANFDGTGQGVTLVQGDRVLIKNNASKDGTEGTAAKRQGIYVVGVVATGSAPLTRDADASTSAMVTCGLSCAVMEGTYAGASFVLTTANPITLDTTSLAFAAPIDAPSATGSALGMVELAGDLAGTGSTAAAPRTSGLNGVAFPATPAAAQTPVTTSTTTGTYVPMVSYGVRGIVYANVATLSTFTVASGDGPTYTAGQVVLLVGQSTASQNGPYVVGTVGGGTAPLTRPAWWATGMIINSGSTFVSAEGTSALGTFWMVTTPAPITVDTTSVTIACVLSPPTIEPGIYKARSIVTANVASLAAFTGVTGGSSTNSDGILAVQGDIVLLTAQTTATQNGPYVVGAVAAGSAALTRPVWWQTGSTQPVGQMITLSGEGTVYKNTEWKAMAAASTIVVDTTDPKFYPKKVTWTSALVAGIGTAGGGSPTAGAPTTAYVFSANTQFSCSRKTPNTSTATIQYQPNTAGIVAGVGATGAASFFATVAAGTINNADISTMVFSYDNQI